jgi:hypothetical protein
MNKFCGLRVYIKLNTLIPPEGRVLADKIRVETYLFTSQIPQLRNTISFTGLQVLDENII